MSFLTYFEQTTINSDIKICNLFDFYLLEYFEELNPIKMNI